jgi:hypothetical protein
MERIRRHLTYANVTATLALVFAMSGGALAAKHYLLSSTRQISPGVLKSFAKKNTALFKKLSATVTVATATTATHATTALNATNATNATHAGSADSATSALSAGSAGTAGTADALNGVQIVHSAEKPNPHESQTSQFVECPAGLHVIGGGVDASGGTEQSVNSTFTGASGADKNKLFFAEVNNTSTGDDRFSVWAVCARVSITE